jgi:hypothetical protein
MDKICGECTACCSGTLSTTIFEHKVNVENPCPFVCKSGCSIYEKRPDDPCKSFKCGWLIHPNIPDYMRPDKSGIILKNFNNNSINILNALQYSNTITDEVNNWLSKVKELVDYNFNIIKLNKDNNDGSN